MKYKRKKQFSGLKKSYKKQFVNRMIYLAKKDILDMSSLIDGLKENDKLIKDSENPGDSIINRTININRTFVPEAYISNSILLLNLIQLSNDNKIKDGYIFPALFCFRQYLELTMKDSIHNFMFVLGECDDSQSGFKKVHSLRELWQTLSMKILRFENNNTDLKIIGKLINEFDSVDESSMAFRYPYQLDVEDNIKPNRLGRKCIEIKNLRDVELKMFRFMEGINELSYLKKSFN